MSHESKELKAAPELSPRMAKVFAEYDQASIPLTREEVVWLALLCDKADRPLENGIPWQAGSPIVYGDSIFWPLTPLADHWWRYWYKRSEGDKVLSAFIFLFACVRSRPGDTSLRELSDWYTIQATVKEWAEGIAWPVAQYEAVYDKVLQLNDIAGSVRNPDEKAKPLGPVNVDNIHTALAKAYPGTPPDYWETCVSIVKQDQLIRSLRNLNQDNGSHSDGPKEKALGALYAAKKWVRKWHTGTTELPDATTEGTEGTEGECE